MDDLSTQETQDCPMFASSLTRSAPSLVFSSPPSEAASEVARLPLVARRGAAENAGATARGSPCSRATTSSRGTSVRSASAAPLDSTTPLPHAASSLKGAARRAANSLSTITGNARPQRSSMKITNTPRPSGSRRVSFGGVEFVAIPPRKSVTMSTLDTVNSQGEDADAGEVASPSRGDVLLDDDDDALTVLRSRASVASVAAQVDADDGVVTTPPLEGQLAMVDRRATILSSDDDDASLSDVGVSAPPCVLPPTSSMSLQLTGRVSRGGKKGGIFAPSDADRAVAMSLVHMQSLGALPSLGGTLETTSAEAFRRTPPSNVAVVPQPVLVRALNGVPPTERLDDAEVLLSPFSSMFGRDCALSAATSSRGISATDAIVVGTDSTSPLQSSACVSAPPLRATASPEFAFVPSYVQSLPAPSETSLPAPPRASEEEAVLFATPRAATTVIPLSGPPFSWHQHATTASPRAGCTAPLGSHFDAAAKFSSSHSDDSDGAGDDSADLSTMSGSSSADAADEVEDEVALLAAAGAGGLRAQPIGPPTPHGSFSSPVPVNQLCTAVVQTLSSSIATASLVVTAPTTTAGAAGGSPLMPSSVSELASFVVSAPQLLPSQNDVIPASAWAAALEVSPPHDTASASSVMPTQRLHLVAYSASLPNSIDATTVAIEPADTNTMDAWRTAARAAMDGTPLTQETSSQSLLTAAAAAAVPGPVPVVPERACELCGRGEETDSVLIEIIADVSTLRLPIRGQYPGYWRATGRFLHVECALWSPEVYAEVAPSGDSPTQDATDVAVLQRVGEAIARGSRIKCAACRRTGATLGCVHAACQRSYHYPCAVRSGIAMNAHDLVVRCPQHARRTVDVMPQTASTEQPVAEIAPAVAVSEQRRPKRRDGVRSAEEPRRRTQPAPP